MAALRSRCGHYIFPIVDMFLICEDAARQICAMVPRWQLFGDFLRAVFSASRMQRISDISLLNLL